MDWSQLLPILTVILTITTGLAAAFAGLMLGTQRTLRSSNDDLRKRVGDLESERAEDRADLAEVRTELAEVRSEKRILESLVQGRVDWTAISDQLEHHHAEANTHWTRAETLMSGILDTLREQP